MMPELTHGEVKWLYDYLVGQREVNGEFMEPEDLLRMNEVIAAVVADLEYRGMPVDK